MDVILSLSEDKPHLDSEVLLQSFEEMVSDNQQHAFNGLSQPAVALLIATRHLTEKGVETFTFPLLQHTYTRWARMKAVAPTQLRINVALWDTNVLRTAFQSLVEQQLLTPVKAKEYPDDFAAYKAALEPGEVKLMAASLDHLSSALASWAKGYAES